MATINNRDKFFWYVEGERIAVVQKKETATADLNKDPVWESPTSTSHGKNLRVHYTAKPTALNTKLSDSPEIPAQFHEALAYRVIAELYKIPGETFNLQLAQYFDMQYALVVKEGKKYSKSNHMSGGTIKPVSF